MPSIVPCLWFDTAAEEAATFYCGVFPNAKVTAVSRYPEGTPGDRGGQVLTVAFELDGKPFTALNGGPAFTFSEAISFQINAQDQAEVDRYWDALLAEGGSESRCGWLKDRFGVSWQVVPVRLAQLMSGPDGAAANRVAQAMMQMVKLDIAALEAAAAG